MKLYSIGYERSGFPGFVGTLRDAGVKTVIDVRDLPLSRRAGFSKRTLAASLAEHGIRYVHMRALGTPKEGRVANKQRKWKLFWSIVDAQLATPEAAQALEDAAVIARGSVSCLLCFEASHEICHRLRVAQEMERRYGFEIQHLSVEPGFG